MLTRERKFFMKSISHHLIVWKLDLNSENMVLNQVDASFPGTRSFLVLYSSSHCCLVCQGPANKEQSLRHPFSLLEASSPKGSYLGSVISIRQAQKANWGTHNLKIRRYLNNQQLVENCVLSNVIRTLHFIMFPNFRALNLYITSQNVCKVVNAKSLKYCLC